MLSKCQIVLTLCQLLTVVIFAVCSNLHTERIREPHPYQINTVHDMALTTGKVRKRHIQGISEKTICLIYDTFEHPDGTKKNEMQITETMSWDKYHVLD